MPWKSSSAPVVVPPGLLIATTTPETWRASATRLNRSRMRCWSATMNPSTATRPVWFGAARDGPRRYLVPAPPGRHPPAGRGADRHHRQDRPENAEHPPEGQLAAKPPAVGDQFGIDRHRENPRERRQPPRRRHTRGRMSARQAERATAFEGLATPPRRRGAEPSRPPPRSCGRSRRPAPGGGRTCPRRGP